MADYCKCGSIKIYGVCSNRKCPELGNKSYSWIINGMEVRFKEPVTKAEAEQAVKDKSPKIVTSKNYHNTFVKPWIPHQT